MTFKKSDLTGKYRIQAITFDAVGTLIVPSPSVGEIYAHELGGLGYELSPQLLEGRFIRAFRQFKKDRPHDLLDRDSWRTIVARTLDGVTPGDDFSTLFSALWHAFGKPQRWSVLPGVEPALKNLHAMGLRLFVLSNNDERLHGVLQGLPIGRYFEEVFVSTELGAEKPSKRVFELVQARIQVVPEHILHVGDSPLEDVQGALNAGWQGALVGPEAGTPAFGAGFAQAGSIGELFGNH